jgi:putative ABC transport system permease protein
LDALAAQLTETYPKDYPSGTRWSLRLEPAQESLTGSVRPTLVVLLAAVGFVLLMGSVNMANLLVARSSARGSWRFVRPWAPRGRVWCGNS